MSEPITLRARLGQFIEARLTQRAIIALILLNAVTLGLETSDTVMGWMGPVILAADTIILSIFAAEVLTKLFVYRLSFWRNPWNVFDFFVVGIALIPASGPFSVLRVLRLLRLVSMVPKLRFIVEALLRAIPGILSIIGLLLLIFYVFAIIATGLFSESFPQKFGSLGATMYSLFQVMTLEGWSEDIARPVMETYPWAWAFFVPFILIATFTVLNLFIAIIVDAMQRMHDRAMEIEQQMIHDSVHEENQALHSEIHQLQQETIKLQERLGRMQNMLEKRIQ